MKQQNNALLKQKHNLEKMIFQIPPSGVYFLKFLLEGYDNLFFLSTVNKDTGTVRLLAAKGAEKDLRLIIQEYGMTIGAPGIKLPDPLAGD